MIQNGKNFEINLESGRNRFGLGVEGLSRGLMGISKSKITKCSIPSMLLTALVKSRPVRKEEIKAGGGDMGRPHDWFALQRPFFASMVPLRNHR